MSEPLSSIPCSDFTYFKSAILRHRKDDDNLNHKLNNLDTHSAAQCERLFEGFSRSHSQRTVAIGNCLKQQEELIQGLKERKAKEGKDGEAANILRTELLKKRLLEGELVAEEIVRDKTLHTFKEKCRML